MNNQKNLMQVMDFSAHQGARQALEYYLALASLRIKFTYLIKI